jgi:hypothetical protein
MLCPFFLHIFFFYGLLGLGVLFLICGELDWNILGGCFILLLTISKRMGEPPCSIGLSATSQRYFSLGTNQPAVLFFQNKPAKRTG